MRRSGRKSTPEVKRQQTKNLVNPAAEGGDRKLGRETRAPPLLVPEREKKKKKEQKEVIVLYSFCLLIVHLVYESKL